MTERTWVVEAYIIDQNADIFVEYGSECFEIVLLGCQFTEINGVYFNLDARV